MTVMSTGSLHVLSPGHVGRVTSRANNKRRNSTPVYILRAYRAQCPTWDGRARVRSVVVVDDSIVRGTTSSKIVQLIRDAGAREVHMRISSPPIVGSCYYGVDTPRAEELISNRMDVEGVRKKIGCDSLAFLSLDNLRKLLGDEAPTFCEACFSQNYPVPPREHKVEKVMEECA